MFKFKDVDVTFEFKKLPKYDQEYLKTMAYETVQTNSVKNSGKSFKEWYPGAKNFTMFNDKSTMYNYMAEFSGQYANTASHLLNGTKYFFAWTYSK